MEGPPLGPGGEDITWPDQVAPRGRKASSTRKIKPQTSNLKPMHARAAWPWPACVRSVYGHVAFAVAVLLVCGPVSRLLVGLFGVASLSSQRALTQSDLLCAGVPLVAMLVGASCVGPAPYVFTVRRPPAAGEKGHDK